MTTKVFVSYSHDSDEHCDMVLAFSERLREDGLDTRLDRYVKGAPGQGWPRWMLNQLDEADFVLIVCTETYYRRFRGLEEPGKGKGANWEGLLVTNEVYDTRRKKLKFVPIMLSEGQQDYIPEPLRDLTYYTLTSESSYQDLYGFLLGQADVEPRELGKVKPKSGLDVKPLNFDRLAPSDPDGTSKETEEPPFGQAPRRRLAVALALLALVLSMAAAFMLRPASVRILWPPGTDLYVDLAAIDDSSFATAVSFTSGATELTQQIQLGWRIRRLYEIRVEGYRPKSFAVTRWAQKTIRLDRDLEIAPTVLFRPPVLALSALQDGGILCVWKRETEESPRIPVARMKGQRQSFQLGTDRRIEPSLIEKWRHGLEERIEDENTISETMVEWQNPVKCAPSGELRPRMFLEAEVHTRAGYLEARIGPFVLDAKPFVDKLMEQEVGDPEEEGEADCLLPDGLNPCGSPRSRPTSRALNPI